MGERGNIVIVQGADEGKTPIYFYTHWKGYKLPEIVRSAFQKGKGRLDDSAYLNRIVFCELVGEKEFNETTGYGISQYICDNNYNLLVIDHDVEKVYFTTEGGTRIPALGEYTYTEFAELTDEQIKQLTDDED